MDTRGLSDWVRGLENAGGFPVLTDFKALLDSFDRPLSYGMIGVCCAIVTVPA